MTADKDGNFKVWDIHRGLSGSVGCIASFRGRGQSGDVRPLLMATCGASPTLVCAERRLDVFRAQELQVSETVPTVAVYNAATMTLLTAGGRHIQVWNAVSGRLKQEFFNVTRVAPSVLARTGPGARTLSGSDPAITCLCLDDVQGKFLVGTSGGDVLYFRCTNGALLRRAGQRGKVCVSPHAGRDVVGMAEVGGGDRLLVTAGWDGRIRVHLDDKVRAGEEGASGEDATIRTIRTLSDACPAGSGSRPFASRGGSRSSWRRTPASASAASSSATSGGPPSCTATARRSVPRRRGGVGGADQRRQRGRSQDVVAAAARVALLLTWRNAATERDAREFAHVRSARDRSRERRGDGRGPERGRRGGRPSARAPWLGSDGSGDPPGRGKTGACDGDG